LKFGLAKLPSHFRVRAFGVYGNSLSSFACGSRYDPAHLPHVSSAQSPGKMSSPPRAVGRDRDASKYLVQQEPTYVFNNMRQSSVRKEKHSKQQNVQKTTWTLIHLFLLYPTRQDVETGLLKRVYSWFADPIPRWIGQFES
jgi:hypothetical protein